MELILAIILGSLFGFALYYVGATQFSRLQAMLRLEDLTLAKIIFFAIGLGSVLLAVTAAFGWFDLSHLSVKTMNVGVLLGGAIFGIAFGAMGTCPGTSFGALFTRAQVKRALLVIFGGLVGALAFTLVYGTLKDAGLFEVLNFGKMTLFTINDEYPALLETSFIGLGATGVVMMAIAHFLPTHILKK